MNLRQVLPIIWALCGACAFADTYVRQSSIDVLHYDIAIQWTDASDSITATTKIKVRIRNESVSGMWLDLEDMSVDGVKVGNVERPFALHDKRLEFRFDRSYSPEETVRIEVRYHGKPLDGLLFGKNKYGQRVVFADNWPNRAHHWFPSIDHPSDKASVSFRIVAPDKYDVVANGRLEKLMEPENGTEIYEWSEPRDIPTYCMVFGIAKFAVSRTIAGKVPLTWYLFPQDAELGDRSFGGTPSILAYFENLIAPYPYEKLAQVESIVRVGGMENSNTIFYSQSLFRGVPAPEEIVVHEIAHQWFGDSVTEYDWDHLWLSEGFATYLEALFSEHLNGPEALKGKMAIYSAKLAGYAPALERPIIDPAEPDPAKKLTPLNYEKGAWVLHMLRGVLGEENFFKGVRRVYSMYEGKNISSADFQKVMESVSGTDLNNFFRQWLYTAGWPEYRLSWHWNESAGELEITVQQVQGGNLFDMPADIAVFADGHMDVHKFRIFEATHTFRIPCKTNPVTVELDPNNWILKTARITQR